MDQDIKVKSKSLKLLEGNIGEYFYEGFKKHAQNTTQKRKTDKFECIKITNIINGHRVSVGKDLKALEADGGDGHTTM